MQTNASTLGDKELYEAGKKLLEAAYDFWKIHNKKRGPGAVVWLRDDNGHFVLFTRGEYHEALIQSIGLETSGDAPLNPWNDPAVDAAIADAAEEPPR